MMRDRLRARVYASGTPINKAQVAAITELTIEMRNVASEFVSVSSEMNRDQGTRVRIATSGSNNTALAIAASNRNSQLVAGRLVDIRYFDISVSNPASFRVFCANFSYMYAKNASAAVLFVFEMPSM